eukprot:CAMPEP_0176431806 /NCGR_PEP_ID=MMETSP0127-20121128/15018_1 /TAXON_ID=938130 /ORGANISM="Platyophrya macrostoma, Strain WH" /LENGTH=355 /DNA_ID=CAMNT_0017813857 /DNA_START=241 /DNA_END=1308 /DNA_ORIENTATION=-
MLVVVAALAGRCESKGVPLQMNGKKGLPSRPLRAASFPEAGRPVTAQLGTCNPNTFSVSGISAGACMAIQFQYAWSSIVQGAGLVAGVPYGCSGGSLSGAEECLNDPSVESPQNLFLGAQIAADAGLIDPLSNLKNQTVMLFSGLIDTVVPHQNMINVQTMLQMAGTERVTTYFNYSAEHAWITDKYGNSCATLGSPYINNCGLDFGGNFLHALFSNLGLKWNASMSPLIAANMFSFDQTQFGASASISMGNTGYMYVPTVCQAAGSQCHLHMNLHGCTQDANNLGLEYVLFTELNEWAESNNVVVLYPQATADLLADNPEACFDWWGYISSDYATKNGPQMSVFRAMIRKFGGF